MPAKTSAISGRGLLGVYLWPSWLSGLVSVTAGLVVVFGTVTLTIFGNTVQQSLVGLHDAYTQNSIIENVQIVTNKIASNTAINNLLLFLMWGLVGLVIYSIVENAARGWNGAEKLLHNLAFFRDKRESILENIFARSLLRILALIGWWILMRLTVYHVIPYAIASAHDTAQKLGSVYSWFTTIALGCLVIICVHGLTVLLRLMVLRTRLFDSDFVE
jgi:hypothetical protein